MLHKFRSSSSFFTNLVSTLKQLNISIAIQSVLCSINSWTQNAGAHRFYKSKISKWSNHFSNGPEQTKANLLRLKQTFLIYFKHISKTRDRAKPEPIPCTHSLDSCAFYMCTYAYLYILIWVFVLFGWVSAVAYTKRQIYIDGEL